MQDYQIFISYKSGPDGETAEQIYNELTKRGYIVFWDQPGIKRGDKYNVIIEKAIINSKLFVLLLSSSIINAHKQAKGGNDLPYIEEVEVPLALKWREKTEIFPFIIDDSNPIDYQHIFPELFKELDLGHDKCPVAQIPDIISSKMDGLQIYPPENIKERYIKNKEIDEGLRSIKPKMLSLLEECEKCPRFSATASAIRCPFIHAIEEHSDFRFFEQESERRTKNNYDNYETPEPVGSDYAEDIDSETVCEEMIQGWLNQRDHECVVYPDEVRNEYEEKWGTGHTGVTKHSPCSEQVKNTQELEGLLRLLGEPIFQQNLVELESGLIEVENSINKYGLVSERFGLYSFVKFVKQQIRRKWSIKRDYLDSFAREKRYPSIARLLSSQVDEAIRLLANIDSNQTSLSIWDNQCFLVIWWLLRDNSSYLTQRAINDAEKGSIVKKLKSLCDICNNLRITAPHLVVSWAIPFFRVDIQEEVSTLLIELSDYQWLAIDESEMLVDAAQGPYSAETDKYDNPIFKHNSVFLCRTVTNRAISFDPAVMSETDFSHGIPFSLYFYPIVRCCRVFAQHLMNNKRAEVVKRIEINNRIDFYYDSFSGKTLLYEESNSESLFNIATKLISEGHIERGREIIQLLTAKQDIKAVVYLANYYASEDIKEFSKAIPLYEIAVEKGVEFCISKLAKCYERVGNYQQAYRWYLITKEIIPSKEINTIKEINLRLGVCCYHMNRYKESRFFFNDAGESGQAGIFKLGLYGSKYEDICYLHEDDIKNENRQQLLLALNSMIKKVDGYLGDFSNIHTNSYGDNKTNSAFSVPCEIDIQKITQQAQENNHESQFLLGALKIEEYIASDAFLKNALGWIRIAANNGNPEALCLLGRYLERFRDGKSDSEQLFEKALNILYPSPFPELSRHN